MCPGPFSPPLQARTCNCPILDCDLGPSLSRQAIPCGTRQRWWGWAVWFPECTEGWRPRQMICAERKLSSFGWKPKGSPWQPAVRWPGWALCHPPKLGPRRGAAVFRQVPEGQGRPIPLAGPRTHREAGLYSGADLGARLEHTQTPESGSTGVLSTCSSWAGGGHCGGGGDGPPPFCYSA